MSMHGTMFTPSGEVVDPTGDIVAQINGETGSKPVAAAAAAPEPPAPVAAPAAQDLLDPARARAQARALVQQAQAELERLRKATQDRKRKRDEEDDEDTPASWFGEVFDPNQPKYRAGEKLQFNDGDGVCTVRIVGDPTWNRGGMGLPATWVYPVLLKGVTYYYGLTSTTSAREWELFKHGESGAAPAAPKAAKTNAGRRSSRRAGKPAVSYVEVDEDHDMSDEEREVAKHKTQRRIVKPKSAKSAKPKWSDEQHQRLQTLMRKAKKSESESSKCAKLAMEFSYGQTNKMLVFEHFVGLEGLQVVKKLKGFIDLLKSKGVDKDQPFWTRENLWKALDRAIAGNDKWFLAKWTSCDNDHNGVVFELTFQTNPPLTSEESNELKALVKSAVHHTGVKKVQDSFNTSYVAQYRLIDFVVEWIKTNGKKKAGNHITTLRALELVREAISASPFRFSWGSDATGYSRPQKPKNDEGRQGEEGFKEYSSMFWEIYLPCDGVFSMGYGLQWPESLQEAFESVWGKYSIYFVSGCQIRNSYGTSLYARKINYD